MLMESVELRVDICINTHKRPDLLLKLLQSLGAQRVDPAVGYRLIVVDNDAAASARQTVETFRAASPMEVVYDVQPVPNIAMTRNRAISHARGAFIAFIDDDETAAPDWLQRLVDASRQYRADVVFGPVVPVFPESAPEWAVSSSFFRRGRHPTGTVLQEGIGANVLVRSSLLLDRPAPLDPAFTIIGGEDVHLFSRLARGGARLVWCDEAVVLETVPASRMCARWIAKRAFLTGNSYGMMKLELLRWPGRLVYVAKCLGLIVVASLATPLAWLVSTRWGMRAIHRAVGNLGQILACCGVNVGTLSRDRE
ncbi:MAG: glycosyltransferase [Candidatus Riflebacteria bacterium]|nr:glycosyltransferase [Candidatus Riflebacteria bacterium]